MKVTRRSVFETNSSSVHVMTIVSKQDYQDWENGLMVYDTYTDSLVPLEYAKKQDKYFPYKDNCIEDGWKGYRIREFDEEGNESLGDFIEVRFLTFEEFDEYYYDNYSSFFKDTPDDKWTVFGYYGYSG